MKRPGPRLGWEITVTRRGLGPYRDPRWNSRLPSRLPNPAPDRRDDPRLTRGSVERPSRAPWPSTLIWRWRWELGILAGVALLAWGSWLATGAWVLVIAPIVVSALTLIPPVLGLLRRRGSAIAVQHRIRVGCSETGLYGPRGALPAILWTRVIPHGERVYLWSSPAVTAERFHAERKPLAAACRSRSLRVGKHPRFARVIVLDVIRRGPEETETERPARLLVPRPRQEQNA